jgi:hypothetical protein
MENFKLRMLAQRVIDGTFETRPRGNGISWERR